MCKATFSCVDGNTRTHMFNGTSSQLVDAMNDSLERNRGRIVFADRTERGYYVLNVDNVISMTIEEG